MGRVSGFESYGFVCFLLFLLSFEGAQFVIERDCVYTKNSNLPHGHGELQLNRFDPFPKNPPISKVFREIGYADELGSGIASWRKWYSEKDY